MSDISKAVRNYFKLELLIGRSHIVLCRLFKNRYSLSTGGRIWDDSSTCGSNYLVNITRKNKKLSLTGVQKTLVSNGDSNEWDLTTLTTLLLNIDRPKNLSNAHVQQFNNENTLLRELRDIRNTLVHHKSKSIVDGEFYQLWSKIETILIALGEDQNDLDKLKEATLFETAAQPIIEENLKEALRLNSTGAQAHQEQNYSEAVALFTNAVVLPGVPNHERAVLYSNMSSSRLALYEQQRDPHATHASDQRYRALQDAKQSRNISPTWWKGHFRVGQVYAMLNEHEKAISSFGRALALAPGNVKIQKALHDSQLVHGRQTRQEHLDPRLAPRTLSEHLNEFNRNLGIDPEKVRLAHTLLDEIDPSAADVVKGHKYEHGDTDVKQDYEQAAKYFAKAAREGNAEGIYNLARLYDRGFGVKKDHDAAFKLLQQAAALPPQHPKLKNLPNVGVAEAQHSLGLRYYEGVVVHKNLSIAAYWYQLATDNGSAESANNLALMHEYGTGVDKDLDKAEQLYELSASRRDPNAMKNLAELLVDKNNLAMAKISYDRACDAGNGLAQMNRETFYSVLQQKQCSQANDPFDLLQGMDKFDQVCNPSTSTETANTTDDSDTGMSDYNCLDEYAERGSITAQKMCRAQMHLVQALDILMQSETLTETQENEFIHELAQCYRTDRIVAKIPTIEMHQKVERLIDRVLRRCNTNPIPFKSQLDEDVRTCYATLHMDSHQLIIQFLRPCKEKYPRSVYFFDLSAHLNGSVNNHPASLYDINIGLELDASHCELLYQKALVLTVLNEDINKIIEAYQAFLVVAPKDHPEVPESYYAMAMCCLIRAKSTGPTDIPKRTYEQGQEAEKLQLPGFLPYRSQSKMVVKGLIDKECSSKAASFPSNNRKLRLTNPRRIEIIKGHRQWAVSMSQMRGNSTHSSHRSTIKLRAAQKMASSLVGLKSITLREMKPTKDHIYQGYVILLTITEEIYSWLPSIHLVVEDENLDCEQVCIYNYPDGQGEYLVKEIFKIGSKMTVINLYLRIGAYDGKPMIRVDDFSSIIIQGESERVNNMCRCCGEPNALHVCSQCAKARYCSKECQTVDWKLYGHKLICTTRVDKTDKHFQHLS